MRNGFHPSSAYDNRFSVGDQPVVREMLTCPAGPCLERKTPPTPWETPFVSQRLYALWWAAYPGELRLLIWYTLGPMADMHGKVVVITGATSGIGWIAAEKLARMGARLVLIARNRSRGDATLARLREAGPGAAHTVHYADLSSIAEMKRVAGEIAASEPRVDVLINNAGALFSSRQVTTDGLEMTFATNHMSYFVVTNGLAEPLRATPGARVVNTSSRAHMRAHLHFDDLQSAKDYRGFPVYGRSKLCNILFTRELAKRWSGTGVTANSLHPGFVSTRFGDQSGGLFQRVVQVAKLFAISPEKGAETILYLATADEVAETSGKYFYQCRAVNPTQDAQDDEAALRLWRESARLAGTGGD
jgi:NAD(P)-dependent dehydrogenase (short-subunit alcohol dehydrogenase family)